MKRSLQVAIEGIENIRTVAALTKEETFVQWYSSRLYGPYKYVPIKSSFVVAHAPPPLDLHTHKKKRICAQNQISREA